MRYIFCSLLGILLTISTGTVWGNARPVFNEADLEGNYIERSIAENLPAGTKIGAPVTATDADGDTLTYSTSSLHIDIDSSTGQLKTKSTLDYEAWNRVGVTVIVSDGTLQMDQGVFINVTNVNEAPMFASETTTREFPASVTDTQNIGDPVSATDPDITDNNSDVNPETEADENLSYSLSGTDSDYFTIDSATGQLKTLSFNDYTSQSSYEVTVTASDGSLSDSITVTISTSTQPVFSDGESADRSIAENTAADVNIGDPVSATDADGDTLTYSLIGAGGSWFTIDSGTGQLKTNAALDHESIQAYTLNVSVSDGTYSVRISVQINVTNVNEAPMFASDTDTRSVYDNFTSNVNFGSPVSATDPDIFKRTIDKRVVAQNTDANPETEAEDSLTYSLGGTDAASFGINSATGQLKTSASLDYETKNSYQVTVTASDGSLSDSITVTINVLDSVIETGDVDIASPPSEADTAPPISSIEISQLVSLLTMDKVIINEIFNGSTDANDWLEFRNISDTAIDFTGWQLSIRSESGMNSVMFPEGTMLPVGEVLLLVNTDPSSPENPLAVPDDGSIHYVVDDTFNLPQMDFALILQSSDGGYEDSVGNYFPNRAMKPETAAPLTPDIAWYRAKPAVIGYQVEAWTESGYRFGRGYDHGTPEAIALGSPGHLHSIPGDLNDDGVVNIQDLVLVASAFGQTGGIADLNSDGTVNIQDLVMVASRFGGTPAPSAKSLHASHVQHWLKLAERKVGRNSIPLEDHPYQKGIEVLEQLLATLIPKSSALLPNFPNPFNPETWIPYRLAKSADVQITIYDARGSVVRQLDMGHRSAGMHQTRSSAAYWDGKNDMGESVASGVYFYTLTAGDFTATRKMLILK